MQSATQKALQGKEISDDMIQGYMELNKHINATIDLIENVTQATKQQHTTIERINSNMSIVKQHTEQSKSMVDKANDIAITTNELAIQIVQEAKEKKIN